MTTSSDPPPPDFGDIDTAQHRRMSTAAYRADPAAAFAATDGRLRHVELHVKAMKATDRANGRWIKAGAGIAGVILTGVSALVVMTLTARGDIEHLQAQTKAHAEQPAHGEVREDLDRIAERVDRTRERQDERYGTLLRRLDQIDASLTKLLEERRGGRR